MYKRQEYTIRENSNNITDQTEQAQMMHLIDKTLFQHKRIAKVKQILFSNGVAGLAQPEVRENLRRIAMIFHPMIRLPMRGLQLPALDMNYKNSPHLLNRRPSS